MRNRTYILLNSLNKEERKLLNFVINGQNRESLKNLYNYFTSVGDEAGFLDKAASFKAAFGKVYDTGKDYLLRNEQRLLTGKIEEVIAMRALKQSPLQSQLLLLNALLNKGLEQQFISQVQKRIKTAEKSQDDEALCEYLFCYLNYWLSRAAYTINDYEECRRLWYQLVDSHLRLSIRKLRSYQLKLGYTERVLQHLSGQANFSPIQTVLDLDEAGGKEALFLKRVAQSYTLSGQAKIEAFQEAIKLVDEIGSGHFEKQKEKAMINLMLGTEYLVSGENEKAVKVFAEAEQAVEYIPDDTIPKLLLNYTSTLSRLERYEEAIAISEKHSDWLEKPTPISERLRAQQIALLLNAGLWQKAEALLPTNLKEGESDVYRYLRLMWVLVFYERSDLEMAHNELINYRKHLSYNKKSETDDELLSDLLRRFIWAQYNEAEKTELKQKLRQLQQELEQFEQKSVMTNTDNLVLRWLLRKNKALLK